MIAMAEQEQKPVGLVCRKCGCGHFRVVYTRPAGGRIMRKKECRHCGTRIVTFERAV
jgi:transcriptional regulator NrdR family protein